MCSLLASIDGQLFAHHVDDEDHVGQVRHRAQAADAVVQANQLLSQQQGFLLGQTIQLAARLAAFQVLHVLDALADRAEVGERAAQPAGGDERHAAAFRFAADGFLRLLLGADEEDQPALAHGVADDLVGVVDLPHGLLEVDDVDAVALREDERAHLGMPTAGPVAEMDTGFEQLLHGNDRHDSSPFPFDLPPATTTWDLSPPTRRDKRIGVA